MSYSGYYRGKTASSTVLTTVCEQSNDEETTTVLSKRTQEKKKGQITTRPVVNATVEARKPKPRHANTKADTTTHAWVNDDQAMLHLFLRPRIEPRPQLKQGASDEEKSNAKLKSYERSLGQLGLLHGALVKIAAWGASKVVIVPMLGVTSAELYGVLSKDAYRRLILAALIQQAKGHTRGGVTNAVLTPDDVLGHRHYGNAASRRRARLKVKREIGTGKPIEAIQVWCDGVQESAVTIEPVSGGWRVAWHQQGNPIAIPLDIMAMDDVHAVPVWFILLRQQGNRKVLMSALMEVYNTTDRNQAKAKHSLVGLLLQAQGFGWLRIEAIAHTNTAPRHRGTDGTDFLEARSPKGFYLHFSLVNRK